MHKTFFRVLAILVVALHAPDAIAGCLPDPPADGDAVVCDGIDSTGYDASGATGLTITTSGVTTLTDGDAGLDSAILVGDGNEVTIGADAEIIVDGAGATGGFGIRGNNDNFIINAGTIRINSDDGRGISINENTTGVLPNGAVNDFEIFAEGVRSIALETGANAGVANRGQIDLIGIESRGISAADRTDYAIASDVSNAGDLNVIGAGAIGIQAGDGWVKGSFVGEDSGSAPGIRNLSGGTIDVSGAGAFGIFAGDTSNLNNNNNSFVLNEGTIDVSGAGAIGVSIGGNDLLQPFAFPTTSALEVTSFENFGEVLGGPNAGPLVEFRSFVSGSENQLRNNPSGRIIADLSGVAIRGSAGADMIVNLGEIEGNIEFNDGDDRYFHRAGATFTGSIQGGAGNDQAILIPVDGSIETFDASTLFGVETLLIGAGTEPWMLSNTSAYTGLVQVSASARFQSATPTTLGGGLTVDPGGALELAVDGVNTPLTIQGASTFSGDLVLNLDPGLMPSATPLRIIEANGGYTGTFAPLPTVGLSVFTETYDAAGLLVAYENSLLAVAQGSNQRAIAQHLIDVDAAGGASPDLQNLIDEFQTSTGDLSTVLFALSPEVYDVHTTVVVEGGRRIANLLLDRPRECAKGEYDPWQGTDTPLPCHAREWSPWLAALGGFRSREKFSDHPRYDSSLGGLAFGIDARPLAGLDVTFAISSQRGTVNAAGAGESTVTLTDVSGHAAWTAGQIRVQGVVSWGHGFHKDRRRIQASETATPLDSRGDTEHDSDRITIAAEVGYVIEAGPVEIEPIGGVDWAWVYQRPIHEDNAGGFGIRIASRDDDVGSINAGVRMSTVYDHGTYLADQLEWMDGVWRPMIDIRWRQMLQGEERDIKGRFQGSPDSVSDFTITGREDVGGFELATGLSFTPEDANRLQFDLRYEAFVSSHTVEQNLTGRVQLAF
jgi:hypothetical protein